MGTLRALRRRLYEDESGFTLVELLVTIIIIGILAAIAIVLFLGQQQQAQDSSVKSDLGGLAAEVQSCHVETDDFGDCDDAIDLGSIGLDIDDTITPTSDDACPNPGFGVVPAAGKIAVLVSGENCYVIAGTSEADDGGSNHVFMTRRAADGTRERTCGPASIQGNGGCPASGTW